MSCKVKDEYGNIVFEGDYDNCIQYINIHETGSELTFHLVQDWEEK